MLKALLERKTALLAKCKDILRAAEAASRLLTDEEQAQIKAAQDEIAQVKSQIALVQGFAEEEETAKAEQQAAPLAVASKTARTSTAPGPEAKKEFESLEEFMTACIANPNDQRLNYQEYKSEQSMGTGSKGGFAVPRQFLPQIRSIDPEEALVRPRATVIPAGNPPDAEVTFPALDQEPTAAGANKVYGGVTVEKINEGGLKPETDFDLRLISLQPQEVAARIPLTDKLLRNWQAASNWATTLLRRAVLGWEDQQFLTGNGIGGPVGVIDAGATYAVNRAVAATVSLADLKAMYCRFKGNEGKAVWRCSWSTWLQLLNMTGDGGGATNVIAVDRSTGTVTIYGIPVKRHERLRPLGQRGDVLLADFSEYVIKDGSGPLVEVGFATGQWERNKRSIKITFNVDGKPWLTKPYRNEENYEVSSFVVLDVPSAS